MPFLRIFYRKSGMGWLVSLSLRSTVLESELELELELESELPVCNTSGANKVPAAKNIAHAVKTKINMAFFIFFPSPFTVTIINNNLFYHTSALGSLNKSPRQQI